jgi:hypothetical protein
MNLTSHICYPYFATSYQAADYHTFFVVLVVKTLICSKATGANADG